MKKLLVILSMFMFIPVLSAETYYDYDKVEVEELPEASFETTNKVYVVGKSYYVTESIILDNVPTYLETGVNYKGQRVYFDYKNPFVEYSFSHCSSCSWIYFDAFYYYSLVTSGFMYSNRLSPLIDSSYDVVGYNLPFGNTGYYLYDNSENYYVISFVSSKDFIIKNFSTDSSFSDFNLDKLFSTTPFYSDPIYSWKQVSRNDVYEIQVSEDDFYFFFTFEDISNFNILQNYDLINLTDFQKIVLVLGFNIFFLGFLGLVIYILIKLLNKGISLLFR